MLNQSSQMDQFLTGQIEPILITHINEQSESKLVQANKSAKKLFEI